jgi:hypothetical protein
MMISASSVSRSADFPARGAEFILAHVRVRTHAHVRVHAWAHAPGMPSHVRALILMRARARASN